MRRYSNHHVELVRVLLASAGVQAIRIVQAYCLGRALAIDVPLGTYFLLIPVVLLVMLLPITVSGLGTSQVAFQYLFGQAGVAVQHELPEELMALEPRRCLALRKDPTQGGQ